MEGAMNGSTRVLDITVDDLEGIISRAVAKEVELRMQSMAVVKENPSVVIAHSQQEAAKLLGLSPSTLVRYIKKGILKDAVRWNGQRRYEYDIEHCRKLIYKHTAI